MPWEALSRALGGQAPPRSLRGFSQHEKLNGLLNSTNDQSSAPWKISIAAFDYWIAIKSLKPCQVLGTWLAEKMFSASGRTRRSF